MGGGSKSLFLPPSGAACSAPQPARSQSCGEGSGSQGGRRGVARASLGLPVRPGHPPYPYPGNLSPSGLQYHHQEEILPLCSLPGKLRPPKARGLESGDHPWPGQAPSGQVSPEKGQSAAGPRTNSREQSPDGARGAEGTADGAAPSRCPESRQRGGHAGSRLRPPDWGLDPGCPGVGWIERAQSGGRNRGEPGLSHSPPQATWAATRNLESRASLSQRVGATTLPWGPLLPPCRGGCHITGVTALPWALLSEEQPSLQLQLSGGREEAAAPAAPSPEKGKPRAQPAPPWPGAHFRLRASFFPKRDQMPGCWQGEGQLRLCGEPLGSEADLRPPAHPVQVPPQAGLPHSPGAEAPPPRVGTQSDSCTPHPPARPP